MEQTNERKKKHKKFQLVDLRIRKGKWKRNWKNKISLWTNNTKNKKFQIFYLVLKFMRFKAPILRDDASVNNFECNSITRHIRYSRRNIGNDNATSYGTVSVPICLFLLANLVVHWNVYCPGIGCTAHIVSSNVIWHIRCHVIAIRQSSAQLSIINSWNGKDGLIGVILIHTAISLILGKQIYFLRRVLYYGIAFSFELFRQILIYKENVDSKPISISFKISNILFASMS